jgi:hypothetical protein
MRGPACNWWAKLTPFSLQADALVLTRDQRTLSGTVRVDFTFGKPVQNAHVKLSVVQNSAAAYGRPVVMDGTDGGPSGGGLGTVVATVTGKTDSKGAMAFVAPLSHCEEDYYAYSYGPPVQQQQQPCVMHGWRSESVVVVAPPRDSDLLCWGPRNKYSLWRFPIENISFGPGEMPAWGSEPRAQVVAAVTEPATREVQTGESPALGVSPAGGAAVRAEVTGPPLMHVGVPFDVTARARPGRLSALGVSHSK